MSEGVTVLLIGCGKMGGAMLAGWRTWPGFRAAVVEPKAPVQTDSAVTLYMEGADLPADFQPDAVVVAVKPQEMDKAAPVYKRFVRPETVFLSIAAGKTIGSFEGYWGQQAAIVRAMPNTPAAVGRGVTVLVANDRVSADQRALCQRLLEAVGSVEWVEDEGLLDAVTAVSGGGPAYVFLLIEALADAGVASGLPRDLSEAIARATVEGSGELSRQSPDKPETLRKNVMSPGGTTAEAVAVLDAADGIRPLFERAIAAATKRSRELA
ncbi:MAG: pyrroline-5-carboxylate reductase [Alphaproteobacteria bacterium]|nr:pyrroline-5-carboxylate reductase [Alphaproteobacteria bacterium]MCB9930620.1 pyrroline-5-carboxylate reductase [Alphaproteobacteria bacterium]